MPGEKLCRKHIKVFYSYAHTDEKLVRQFDKHLASFKRQGIISEWYDRHISPGGTWEKEIDTRLDESQIILCFVSADFLASDYCFSKEMKRSLRKLKVKGVRIIPVILRPVEWETSPLGKLQALPGNAKPVTSWENRDAAFQNIAQGIRKAVQEVRNELKNNSLLLIEDEPEWQEILTRLLKRADFDVTDAFDYGAALKYLEITSQLPILAIVDLHLRPSPTGKLADGFRILDALRKKSINSIVVSAYTREVADALAQRADVLAVINKTHFARSGYDKFFVKNVKKAVEAISRSPG